MKIKLFATLAICFFAAFSTVAVAADIVISTAITSSTNFTSNDQTITIASGGNVSKTGSPSDISSIGAFTNLHLVLNATTGQGLSNTSTSSGAVALNSGSVSEITLNSGRITANNGSYTGTISLTELSGTATITLASGTSIANTSSTFSNAITHGNIVSDANLIINNSGTISSTNAADSSTIILGGATDASIFTINNTGGTISAGALGTAVSGDIGTINITNSSSGIITGAINASDSITTINNSSALSTITGNINLGSRTTSSITNSGIITGNLTFGDAAQTLNLNTGGYFTGAISGAGIVKLSNSSNLVLNSGTLVASVNGTALGNIGNLEIANDQSVVVNTNIGSSVGLSSLLIDDGATLNFSTNNKAATFTYGILNAGSILDIGSATLHGNVYSNTTEGLGTINFHQDYTLGGIVGVGGFGVDIISVAAGKTITASGNYDISARSITINDGAAITTTGGGRLDGAVSLGDGSSLTVGAAAIVNGSIAGIADNQGILNTTGGSVTLNSTIGDSTHDLASFNIGAGSTVAVNQNIHANEVNFAGELDLNKSGGSEIFGNLTGSGSGVLDVNSGLHLVRGSFNIASGNTLAVDVVNTVSSGAIYSTEASSLSANTILHVSLNGATERGSRYLIVNAATGSTLNKIADSNILIDNTSSNRVGNLKFTTEVGGNELILNVVGATAEGISHNQSQFNAYDGIVNASNATGNLLALQNYLDSNGNSDSSKATALESVTPEADNSSNRISFNSTNSSLNMTSQRLSSLRGVSSGDEMSKKSAWAQTFGATVNQGNTADSGGYKAGSFGFAGGFDHEIGNDVIGGISFSYANSNIKSRDNLKKTRVDSYQVNLYASKDFEKFFLNGLAGVALNRYSSSRSIPTVGASAKADYSGQTYIARVEAGKNLKLKNDFVLTPTLAITAARNNIGDYSEGGAGTLNLAVNNRASDFFETRAGAELGKDFKFSGSKKIHPAIFASYGYDFAGNKQHASARFVGQSASFASSGANIAQGSLRVGTSLKFYQSNFFSVNLDYAFEQRTNYSSHSGSLKAKYDF